MRKGIAAAVVIAVVIVGLIFVLFIGKRQAEAPSPANQSSQQSSETADEDTTKTTDSALTIVYTDAGFTDLGDAKIKSGDKITVRNDSSRDLDFASDEHPSHQDNSEFNIGTIDPGASRSFTVTTKGKWGIHNHDFSGHTGVITVE